MPCCNKKKVFFVSLEEPPQKILTQATAFEWNISTLTQEGMVQIFFSPIVDVDIDEFIIQLGAIVRQHHIKRVVLDSLLALINRVRDVVVLREKLFYLTTYLNNLGCTTLLLYPTGKEVADEQLGIVQSLVQGSILLTSTLFHNRRLRLLELYKLRGVNHVTGNHLMEITKTGIQVFPRLGGCQI